MRTSLILKKWAEDLSRYDIIVASTGYVSREIYRHLDRPLSFYCMGSMGNALALGMGLALSVKNRVVVFNGDGSALMSLGSMITMKRLKLKNLVHVVLDNNSHASTGVQKTNSDLVNFSHLCPNTIVYKCEYDSVPPRIPLSPKQITRRLQDALKALSNKSV